MNQPEPHPNRRRRPASLSADSSANTAESGRQKTAQLMGPTKAETAFLPGLFHIGNYENYEQLVIVKLHTNLV